MKGEVCHACHTSFCRVSSAFLLRKFTSKTNTTPGVSRHNLAWGGILTFTAYMTRPCPIGVPGIHVCGKPGKGGKICHFGL